MLKVRENLMKFKKVITGVLFLLISSFAGVEELITEFQFNQMFPNRGYPSCAADGALTTYTYANLVEAASWFPDFANVGTLEERKRELAAFLAHTSHETGGGDLTWGYCFTQEVGCNNGTCNQYNQTSNTQYPAVSGNSYHGRGAIQLSWNYNYGPASEDLTGDKMLLLNNPDLVKNSQYAYLTAIWFWMNPANFRPSPHDIINGAAQGDSRSNKFSTVTNAINGGIECGNSSKLVQQNRRVGYFQKYANDLGISFKPSDANSSDNNYLYCTNQSPLGISPWVGSYSKAKPNICKNGSCDGTVTSSNNLSSSNISSSSSSSVISSSSSVNQGECSREEVMGYRFNVVAGSTALAGYQQNNYDVQGGPFQVGDRVVPKGADCSLAITLAPASDTWNLYFTSSWAGQTNNGVILEKVTQGTTSNQTFTTDSENFYGVEFKMTIDSVVEVDLDTLVTTIMDSIAIDTLVVTQKSFEDGVEYSSISDTTISRDTIQIGLTTETLPFSSTVVSGCMNWKNNVCAWDGSAYACTSTQVTDNGIDAYRCVSGQEPFCNGYGPSENYWNQWQANGSCQVVSSIANSSSDMSSNTISSNEISSSVHSSSSENLPTITFEETTRLTQVFEIQLSTDSVIEIDQDTIVTITRDSIVTDTVFTTQDSLSDGVVFWTQVDTVVSVNSYQTTSVEVLAFIQTQQPGEFCQSWYQNICAWDGYQYDCQSNRVSKLGDVAYSCAAGSEPFCNAYSPELNYWGQWIEVGSCENLLPPALGADTEEGDPDLFEAVADIQTPLSFNPRLKLEGSLLTVSMPQNQSMTILIANTQGELVGNYQVQDQTVVNLSEFKRGIYFIKPMNGSFKALRITIQE